MKFDNVVMHKIWIYLIEKGLKNAAIKFKKY